MTTTAPEPTPGDVARFALHSNAEWFGLQMAAWCDSESQLKSVTDWVEAVYFKLRETDLDGLDRARIMEQQLADLRRAGGAG